MKISVFLSGRLSILLSRMRFDYDGYRYFTRLSDSKRDFPALIGLHRSRNNILGYALLSVGDRAFFPSLYMANNGLVNN